MNGTFKSLPDIYLQLFTIHVFEGDKLIPIIYCRDLQVYLSKGEI